MKVSTSENGGDNILKRMKITNPTQQQKDDAEKKAIEEHHEILFILGADKYKYGKLIEDMKKTSSARKIRFIRQLVRQVTYFLHGRIIMVENTTMEKVAQTMVWPLLQ